MVSLRYSYVSATNAYSQGVLSHNFLFSYFSSLYLDLIFFGRYEKWTLYTNVSLLVTSPFHFPTFMLIPSMSLTQLLILLTHSGPSLWLPISFAESLEEGFSQKGKTWIFDFLCVTQGYLYGGDLLKETTWAKNVFPIKQVVSSPVFFLSFFSYFRIFTSHSTRRRTRILINVN